jgi:hypothetical protein
MSRRRPRRRYRDASVTLEFILVLPLLVVTLFAVAQFTVALLVRQAVTHAATVGAREAGKHEDIEEVARVVDAVLEGSHDIDVADVALAAPPPPREDTVTPVINSGVRIVLEVGQLDTAGRPAQAVFSDPNLNCQCDPPASPVLQSDEVRVTVCFEMRRHPICNWLYSFSDDYVDFGNRILSASALVKKE